MRKPSQHTAKPPRPHISPRPPDDSAEVRAEKARLIAEFAARRGVLKIVQDGISLKQKRVRE